LYEPESTRFGRSLDGCFGCIMIGKRADLVVMRLLGEPGAYRPEIRHVFVGGREVYTGQDGDP
jgi:hypothetical protein